MISLPFEYMTQLAWAKDARLCFTPGIQLFNGWFSTTLGLCTHTNLLDLKFEVVSANVLNEAVAATCEPPIPTSTTSTSATPLG